MMHMALLLIVSLGVGSDESEEHSPLALTTAVTDVEFLVQHYERIEHQVTPDNLAALADHLNIKILDMAEIADHDPELAPFVRPGFCRLALRREHIPVADGFSRDDLERSFTRTYRRIRHLFPEGRYPVCDRLDFTD